jgi:hypothetical protein
MEKNKEINFKKLLCYNIVNNIKCLYKSKCMFAHTIEEQKKDTYRNFIYKMIYEWNDLSNININEDKELYDDLIICTKECKNCINKICPGGYNCKFGVCLKELKICYNDLLYGKCYNQLTQEKVTNTITTDITNEDPNIKYEYNKTNKELEENSHIIINRCIYGIHFSEKNLIPYYQRISSEINLLDYGSYMYDNINYYSKINTISLILNDNTIKIVKKLLNKNNKSENIKQLLINLQNNINEHHNIDDFDHDDILSDIFDKNKINTTTENIILDDNIHDCLDENLDDKIKKELFKKSLDELINPCLIK